MSFSTNDIFNSGGPGSSAEPSMEEILASIRRILKEDDTVKAAPVDLDDDVLVLDQSMLARPADVASVTYMPLEPPPPEPPAAALQSSPEPLHFSSEPTLFSEDFIPVPGAPAPAAYEPVIPLPEPPPAAPLPAAAEPAPYEPVVSAPSSYQPAIADPPATPPAAPPPTAYEPLMPAPSSYQPPVADPPALRPPVPEPAPYEPLLPAPSSYQPAIAEPPAASPAEFAPPPFVPESPAYVSAPVPAAPVTAAPLQAAPLPSVSYPPPPPPIRPEPPRLEAKMPENAQENVEPPHSIISEKTTDAAASSIGALVRSMSMEKSVAVSRHGVTIEDIVREEIRPLLKSWLDTHLPSLVERVVRTEIERVIDRSGT